MSQASTHMADEAARVLLGSLGMPDPYPAYARLRSLAPIYVPTQGPVVLTSYRAVSAMLHSPHAGKDSDARFRQMGLADWRDHAGLRMMFESILQLDDPDHGRLRAVVSKVFTARRVEAMRASVRAIVAHLIDRLRERAGEPVDLIAEWAFPLPVAVIGDLLGVPEQDRPQFADWVRDHALSLEPGMGPEELARCDAAATQLSGYFHNLVASRRRAPADDLTSALAGLPELTDDELITMLVLLFAAGFETTTHLLGNAVIALVANPDQITRWRENPGLTANAVEELVRFDSPVQLNSRVTHVEVDIDGQQVPAGRVVFNLLGAANRDPSRFPDPDRLDLGRSDARSMSFGAGPHFCLGAALARIEAAEALPALFDTFEVSLDGEPQSRPGLALRGHAHIPVHLAPRGPAG
jgi:cytochrome P450